VLLGLGSSYEQVDHLFGDLSFDNRSLFESRCLASLLGKNRLCIHQILYVRFA
jgi:hypothetical protein